MSDQTVNSTKYRWARPGDINAFFGLMLDNVTGLMFLVLLLTQIFGFPQEFVVSAMVPGTALGVVIGDLAFFFLAFRLAKKTGSSDVTAMPLGLDTPSTFGFVFFILGPSYAIGVSELGLDSMAAAMRTWHIGIWCIVLSGILKLVLAPMTNWIRRVVPRAGLLGSLAAIALVLISFMPLMHIFHNPLPGMFALGLVLTSLIAKLPLPGRTPGTLAALIVAGIIYYIMCFAEAPGYHLPSTDTAVNWFPTAWLDAWQFGWVSSFSDALQYLPIAFPFAIGTVVGGIDCTESAAAAGDDYHTPTVIAIEGIATLLAGLSGGVIQTTPYIGHPAYKAMGGRAAYTLATALLIGTAGLIGYFQILNAWIPVPVIMPILVFIGVEITAQSFQATPKKHYAAVAVACLPALAFLAFNYSDQLMGDFGKTISDVGNPELAGNLQTLRMLSSGFILTSLFWAWALAAAIDRKLNVAAIVMVVAAIFTLFGVMHSPLPGNQLFVPLGPESWGSMVLDETNRRYVLEYAGGYAVCALMYFAWGFYLQKCKPEVATEQDAE